MVLSADELKAFEELERHHTEQVGSSRSPRFPRRIPLAFVVLWWIAVLTVILGAVRPGLGMAVAVGMGWLLWRYLPALGDWLEDASDVADHGATRDLR
jgi:hypothetical protein